jgi:fermentation-respiration switch protein FrsA (DUF1100 family)
MRFLMILVRIVVVVCIGAYVGVIGWLYVNQRDLVFRPDPQAHDAASLGLHGFRDIEIRTQDGETLRALFRPADPGRVTILYLHGNAARLPRAIDRMRLLTEDGAGLLFVSYRGFSGSTGAPSENGLAEDARSAYDWVVLRARGKIALYGESLGTGVAVRLATTREVDGLILDAPFTSTVAVGSRIHWYAPVAMLMKDRFDSLGLIAQIHVPLLVLHGDADRVVPFDLGEKLFVAANEPKTFIRVAGGSHSRNLESRTAEVRQFLRNLETQQNAEP